MCCQTVTFDKDYTMATDQVVSAGHVLKAVMELDRRGTTKVLAELEKLEPDLTEHLLESLSQVHRRLMDVGLSVKDVRSVHRRAERTALVCVMALRQAYRDLLGDAGDAEDSTDESAEPP